MCRYLTHAVVLPRCEAIAPLGLHLRCKGFVLLRYQRVFLMHPGLVLQYFIYLQYLLGDCVRYLLQRTILIDAHAVILYMSVWSAVASMFGRASEGTARAEEAS